MFEFLNETFDTEDAESSNPSNFINPFKEMIRSVIRQAKEKAEMSMETDLQENKFETIDQIEDGLKEYRKSMSAKLLRTLAQSPEPVKAYAKKKMLIDNYTSPMEIVTAMEEKLYQVIQEHMSKLETSVSEGALILNHLVNKKEVKNYPTLRKITESLRSTRLCSAPYCFEPIKAKGIWSHLQQRHDLSHMQSKLFADWQKTDARLWRCCNICSVSTPYMYQHLTKVHKETDTKRHSKELFRLVEHCDEQNQLTQVMYQYNIVIQSNSVITIGYT